MSYTMQTPAEGTIGRQSAAALCRRTPWDRFAAGAALYECGSACELRGAVKPYPPLLLRRYGVSEPYEKLKAFTRGVAVTQESMQARPGVLGLNYCPYQTLNAVTQESMQARPGVSASHVASLQDDQFVGYQRQQMQSWLVGAL